MEKFFINCNEATLICDKTQYNEAGFWERIKLSIHLLTCKYCKVYTKQNAIITKVISYKKDGETKKCLTKTEKTVIKKTLEKTL